MEYLHTPKHDEKHQQENDSWSCRIQQDERGNWGKVFWDLSSPEILQSKEIEHSVPLAQEPIELEITFL